MTDTISPVRLDVRPYGPAAALAGVVVTVLGIVGASSPDLVGRAWFATVVPAALLFAVGLVGIRRLAGAVGASGLVTGALATGAVAMTLFALAHAYALADEDTAILLFSVFMVLAALSLIVAAAGMFRGPGALPRWTVLVAGVWPLATIPVGGALGDLPQFAAIAGWGLTWIAVGLSLVRAVRRG